jgi:hypothetical protein
MKAMTVPCAQCPWRRSNQGRPHPHGWYTRKNLRRLWNGLRTGEAPGMSCHPTDTDNEVPAGGKTVPEGMAKRECAGALLLVQRELKLLETDPKGYLKARGRRGLSREGVAWWALSRCQLANTPLGGPSMPVIPEDADVGYPLEPVSSGR